MNWVIALLCVEILSGITMFYLNFPFGSQTVHVLIATILFGVQLYLLLENRKKNTK
jgi:cytochrome c oxidase assembly protein subunit 15